MTRGVAVIGAGWAGLSTAHQLQKLDIGVEVFEATASIGGHSATSSINGVVYEPEGPHIFHTSDVEVAAWVQQLGLNRPFEHRVKTRIQNSPDDAGQLFSWPLQIREIQELDSWPTIRDELNSLPSHPAADNFEDYVKSLMGPTLYDMFIRGYTLKQWGRDPKELSSSFAPKRVEIRDDSNTRLFNDRWEFFSADGMDQVFENAASDLMVHRNSPVVLDDLADWADEFHTVVVTAPLDNFVGAETELEWRGIRSEPIFYEVGDSETVTESYQINHPSEHVSYTRTIETKHATGQHIEGTVVCREYPGTGDRHYPVPTVDRRNEQLNESFKRAIVDAAAMRVEFTGRLSNYVYINQDEAITDGFATARRIANR